MTFCILDKARKASAIHVEFHERNIALFTRRCQVECKDEKIYKFEIATPSIVSYDVEEDGYFGLATRTETRNTMSFTR